MIYKKNSVGNFFIFFSFLTRNGNIFIMFFELKIELGLRFFRIISVCSNE